MGRPPLPVLSLGVQSWPWAGRVSAVGVLGRWHSPPSPSARGRAGPGGSCAARSAGLRGARRRSQQRRPLTADPLRAGLAGASGAALQGNGGHGNEPGGAGAQLPLPGLRAHAPWGARRPRSHAQDTPACPGGSADGLGSAPRAPGRQSPGTDPLLWLGAPSPPSDPMGEPQNTAGPLFQAS